MKQKPPSRLPASTTSRTRKLRTGRETIEVNRVFREGDRVLIATDQSNVRKGPARFPGVYATIIRRNQIEDRHGGLWLVELIDPACQSRRVVPIHGIHLTLAPNAAPSAAPGSIPRDNGTEQNVDRPQA